ncbi:unnamed protein product [Mucor hiemalis]
MRLTAIASLVALSAASASAAYDKVILYADSFSDNGNDYSHSKFPPSPPYYEGRFSNGPTWAEYVAKNISIPFSNNGYGGATTNNEDAYSKFNNWTVPGLKQQVATLDTKGTSNSLYIIEIGYNDLNSIVNPDQYNVVNKNYTYEKVAANVVSSVKDIITKFNATDFIIMNVAPFDRWPVIKEADKSKTNELITTYNAYAEAELKKIPNVKFTFVDSHAWFVEQLDHPEKLNLSTTNGPCVPGIGNTDACSDPQNHFFFDSYHPEAKVHKAWGEWAIALLKKDFDKII